MIVAHCESANDDSTLYAGAGNFYLIAFAIIKVAVDFAQGEYRQSDGPQAKITDADLAARNHQRIAECIFQMSMTRPFAMNLVIVLLHSSSAP